jgi:hypothetical protein
MAKYQIYLSMARHTDVVYEKLTDERSQRKGEREEREKEGKERREGEKRKSKREPAHIFGSEKRIGATRNYEGVFDYGC